MSRRNRTCGRGCVGRNNHCGLLNAGNRLPNGCCLLLLNGGDGRLLNRGHTYFCGLFGIYSRAFKMLFCYVRGQVHAVGRLVERPVEGRKKEHHYLCSHAEEEHEVGTGQVCKLEKGTKDNDRCAPTVCVVEESLSGNAIHPLLQTIDEVVFTVRCHLLFCF